MRRRSIGLVLLGAIALMATASPKVTDTRSLADYEGRWSSVQFGLLTFELKNSSFSVIKADTPDAQKWVGKTHIRNIAPTSTKFDFGPYGRNLVQQAFYAECAVHSEQLIPSDRYVPCGLLLEDSAGSDGTVKRRFIVRLANEADARTLAYKTLYGFFDLRKAAR